ncbi:hypothetical protein B0H10DRAFT_1946806 [Mycena sp. CBHHK59/15]|nr:hypothetical protein B0H10DRAFT_1946806 [Mycena sp. CBHHK59/15]
MPNHPGLRHFKNGISSVSQWTGTEHKKMEKVFLGLVATGAHHELVKAVRAVMDFACLVSLQYHTLITFHAHKKIFIALGERKEHVNIPKIHSLEHYEPSIHLFGSADRFNTESPERLHIDNTKNGYRVNNHKDYIIQLTLWLQRQESVTRFTAFHEWMSTPSPMPASTHLPTTISIPPLPNASGSASAPTEDDADTLIHCTYSIVKRPPPATHWVVASHIIAKDGHNATRFLSALSQFLRTTHNSTYTTCDFDVFPTWKRLKFMLPNIPEVSQRHATNLVRATSLVIPPGEARYRAIEPAYHDFGLVNFALLKCASFSSLLATTW